MSFAIRVPPGFTAWATAILKPSTLALIRTDKRSCEAVLGAFFFALLNADVQGTNLEFIPTPNRKRKEPRQ